MGQQSIDRLTDEDVQILKREHGPIRGHTCKVLVLERAGDRPLPTLDQLRRHVGSRLDHAPRLRQRVAPTPLGLANPVWLDDQQFDIAKQIRPAQTDGPVDRAELLRIAARLMSERLDRSGPLWRLDVVERLDEDHMALIWRIHHCMADGNTCVRLGAAVLWSDQPCDCGPARDWTATDAPPRMSLLTSGLADRARGAVGRVHRSRGNGVPISESANIVKRELGWAADVTPLAHRAGSARSVAFAEASLEECKRAGKSIDPAITLNDVVLALVAGGVRTWLERDQGPARTVRVKVPVSLHSQDEGDGVANRDSYFFVDLPLAEPDPVKRLLAINRQTAQRKLDHDAETVYRLGRHSLVAHWAMSPHVFTFSVSNVRGPAREVYVLSARVREMHSLAEIAQHHALRVAVISFAGSLFFGLCADRESVRDLEGLADALEHARDELLQAAG